MRKSGETKQVKKKNLGGRPKKELDKNVFEQLCSFQCTMVEICCWFDIDDMTLDRWCIRTYGIRFSEIFKIKRGKGLISLRRSQFQMAQTTPSMSIWLGKQYLNQREPDNNISNEIPTIPEFEKMSIEELDNYIDKNK